MVGYRVKEYTTIGVGKSARIGNRTFTNSYKVPLRVVTRWLLFEVSIVPVGADPAARIRSQGTNDMPMIISRNSITDRQRITIGALESACLHRWGHSDPAVIRAAIGNRSPLELEQEAELGRGLAEEPFIRNLWRAAELDGAKFHGDSDNERMAELYHQHRGLYSTANLVALFSNTTKAVYLSIFDNAGDSTRGWCDESDALTMKREDVARLVGEELTRRPRGVEADHMSFADSSEQSQLACYARQLKVDEQDIIDGEADNLMSLFATSMGNAAASLRPTMVYSYLRRNPVMSDGVALFHADHGNLKTGAALADDKLSAALAAVAQQEENGVKLNLRATHLIVPALLERTAQKLARDVYVGDGQSTPPPIVRSDSRLDNGLTDPFTFAEYPTDTTSWYVATARHALQVRYLKGTDRKPQLLTGLLDTPGRFGFWADVQYYLSVLATDYRGICLNQA